MFQLNNREIYKQLRQNKDGIQDDQTHHQHLKAASAALSSVLLNLFSHYFQTCYLSGEIIKHGFERMAN